MRRRLIVLGVIAAIFVTITVLDNLGSSPPTRLLCALEPTASDEPDCTVFSRPRFPLSLLGLFRNPGYDPSRYEVVDAVRLRPNQLAIYQTLDGRYVHAVDVGYTTLPVNRTTIYPTSPVIIITERDPEKCQQQPPFRYCDTPMDNIILQGGVTAVADFSITFEVAVDLDSEMLSASLEDLYAFGGMQSLIDQVKQNVRSVRSEMSDVAPALLTDPTSNPDSDGIAFAKDSLIDRMYAKLTSGTLGSFITVNRADLNVRSFVITSQDYLDMLNERVAVETQATVQAIRRETERINNDFRREQELEMRNERVAAETQATVQAVERETERINNEFRREQELADAENYREVIERFCTGVPDDESCAAMMWILFVGNAAPAPLNIEGLSATPPPQRDN